MKHSLSFCEVTQISDYIYEAIDNEGVVIDAECAREVWDFWSELRQEPFGLLVHCKNSFSVSFEGAQNVASHPLQQKTAILVCDKRQIHQIKTVMSIKETLGHDDDHKVFYGGESAREEAIEWLSQ